MRIVFAGTPEFAVPSLRALVAAGHEVVGVITRLDAPLGRKRVLTPSPVARVADELGLPVLKQNRLDDAATEWVAGLGADLGVIVAYGGLVREPLLSAPAHGWINLHFSELPRWRGAAPVQRALMAGEQRLGVTVFRLVAELDAGAVLSRDERLFAPGTSAGAALTELAEFGTGALERAIGRLDDDPAAGEAQQGEASYAHKLERGDGRLDLARSGSEVLAHWAGVTPEPGAWVVVAALSSSDGPDGPEGSEPVLKLNEVALVEQAPGANDVPAGTVRLVDGRAILHLIDGALMLERVQPAGKAAMDGAAWLRGRGGQAVLA